MNKNKKAKEDLSSDLLKKFGYPGFMDNQEEIIKNILDGNDVVAVMPTGSGKSFCFQFAAAYFHYEDESTAIVISPLVALMEDQVKALGRTGIPAAMLSSSKCTDINVEDKYGQTADTQGQILYRARRGAYALIYLSPERLISHYFVRKTVRKNANDEPSMKISMIVVDEAHCITQWGFQFRRPYIRIPQFAAMLENRPQITAFTATASIQGQQDIIGLLKMKQDEDTTGGRGTYTFKLPDDKIHYDRNELDISVRKVHDNGVKKRDILKFLQNNKSKDGIIFFNRISLLNEIYEFLNTKSSRNIYDGELLKFYSSPSSSETKEERDKANETALSRFMQEKEDPEKGRLMLATNAFGMGMDKKDIGFVIHFAPPQDIESYYQEIGRAGRGVTNSCPCTTYYKCPVIKYYKCPCIMFYKDHDLKDHEKHIESFDNPEETLYPHIRSAVSARELELSILDSCQRRIRFNTMESFLEKALDLNSSEIMGLITDYFKNPEAQGGSEVLNDTYRKISSCLKNKETVDKYLDAFVYKDWNGRFFKDLDSFINMLDNDIRDENKEVSLTAWEHNMAEILPAYQDRKEWLYCNDTLLAKKLRKGSVKYNTFNWFKLNKPPKDKEGNTTEDPVYTCYRIYSSKEEMKLTWFDMAVADAVCTLWSKGHKVIYIHDIINRLTGNTEGSGKYDARSPLCGEIKASLERMSQDITISFPLGKYKNPNFTFNEKLENIEIYAMITEPFLPLRQEEGKKQNGRYILAETPLLYQYAEYLREIISISADELHVTDEHGNGLRQNSSTVKLQVYTAMRIHVNRKVAHNPHLTRYESYFPTLAGTGAIRLYRQNKNKEKERKYEYLCEILDLDASKQRQRNDIEEKLEKIMQYHLYIGTISKFNWNDDHSELAFSI